MRRDLELILFRLQTQHAPRHMRQILGSGVSNQASIRPVSQPGTTYLETVTSSPSESMAAEGRDVFLCYWRLDATTTGQWWYDFPHGAAYPSAKETPPRPGEMYSDPISSEPRHKNRSLRFVRRRFRARSSRGPGPDIRHLENRLQSHSRTAEMSRRRTASRETRSAPR